MANNDRQELDDLRRLDELEQKAASGGTGATPPTRVLDPTQLTDQHEIDFVNGRQGQLSDDQMQEAIRQYRAIRKADEGISTRGNTRIPTIQAPPPIVPPSISQAPIAPPTTIPPNRSYTESLQGYLPKTFIPPQTRGPASTEALEPPVQMLTAPLAAARDTLLGGTPREVADRIFGPPSTDWKENIIPGAMEGLLDFLPTIPFLAFSKGRTPSHPTKLGTTVIESPETKPFTVPPENGLFETVPQGAAYSGQELLTPPGSRILGGQFSTGTGESLFGPMQRVDAPTTGPMGGEPTVITPSRLWKAEGITGPLQEKYPTIEEQPIPKPQASTAKELPKAAGIDMGAIGPSGEWVPPKDYTEPPTPSKWRQAWNAEKQRWGQELPVLNTHADSPVITAIEGLHVTAEDAVANFTRKAETKSLMKFGDNTKLAPLEKQWIEDWKAGRDPRATMPENFRNMHNELNSLLDSDNTLLRRRGLPEIQKVEGFYAPRLTDEDFKLERSVLRGQEGAKMSQGVGPFGQARTIETLDKGMKKGITYKDWRLAYLMRKARSEVLHATDQMMTDLENGNVIHRTKEAAEAASLTHKAYPAEGLPFSPKGGIWWVRSAEERQFLLQNVRPMGSGILSDIRNFAQQYLRNPSLINPLPHIVKNMGLKQMQQAIAGGLNPAQVLKQTYVYRWGNPDMLEEFQRTMPFSKTGETMWELIERAGPKTAIQRMERIPGVLNSYARKKIFAEWDPAMRYGLWREYVRKGMSLQEAANNAWIDLVRYGTRADRIDAWGSVPFNFFVPWRIGTLRTMNKALQSTPVRVGLFIGAVDIIREMDYRYNNMITHIPYDYFERPLSVLAHSIKEGKPLPAMEMVAATMAAGPGGEFMFRNIQSILKIVQGKGGMEDIRALGWGMAQVYDLWPQYEAWTKDHNPKHITDMLGLILVGRHPAPYGGPPRFGELIPEGLIRRSPQTLNAEAMGKAAKEHSEAGQTQRMLRSIEKYKQPWEQVP